MDIDIHEFIEAAKTKTKPSGFQPFYPDSGPGLGGHFISVDSFYLPCKAKEFDYALSLAMEPRSL
jgi:UDP-N-acetyl-D-mannosaminuronate dehydrogenase